MMKRCLPILAVLLLAAPAAQAKVTADFIEGTYAADDGCDKWRAVEAGGPKTIDTVPEVLTKDGFKSWEGGCEFTQVLEHAPGKIYLGIMYCSEGQTFVPDMTVFIRNDDGSLDVAGTGEEAPTNYRRCDGK
jgi:hypothetical protein